LLLLDTMASSNASAIGSTFEEYSAIRQRNRNAKAAADKIEARTAGNGSDDDDDDEDDASENDDEDETPLIFAQPIGSGSNNSKAKLQTKGNISKKVNFDGDEKEDSQGKRKKKGYGDNDDDDNDGSRRVGALSVRVSSLKLMELFEVQLAIIVLIYLDMIASVLVLLAEFGVFDESEGSSSSLLEQQPLAATIFGISAGILRVASSFAGFTVFFFMVEIAALVFVYGTAFFTHVGYLLDFVIVATCITCKLIVLVSVARLACLKF
jgi:hypothetical protein